MATRFAIYMLVILLMGCAHLYMEYQRSLADYEHDKSAMAVWGFLPFIFPIFFAWPAMIVGAVAAVIELAILLWRVLGSE